MNTAMEDIANGATNQAGEMQKVNEQISDMNEAIAETTKNVENLTGSTEEMKEQNHKLDGHDQRSGGDQRPHQRIGG